MRIIITCKQCGRLAEVKSKGMRPHPFCSNACYHKSKIGKPVPIPRHLLGGGTEGHQKQALALRGRAQTEEHRQKRRTSYEKTLAKTIKRCIHCGDEFTPTAAAARYCSGRCWNAVHRKRDGSKRFTIPQIEYDRLLALQHGLCAICGQPNRANKRKDRLAVDHCHKTNLVRGLLCHQCNKGIGHFTDNPQLLKNAIRYLQITSPEPAKSNGQRFLSFDDLKQPRDYTGGT